jgi:hypothetical protein
MAGDETGARGHRLSTPKLVLLEQVKMEFETEMKQELTVRLNEDATDPRTYRTFELHGISAARLRELKESEMTEARWRTVFPVFVAQKEDPARIRKSPTPMLGSYQLEGELVRFSPRYPLLQGQRYGVRFMLDGGVTSYFTIPIRAAPSTQVTQIYPSADLLPENLLRFYIYFSASMREGESLQHIHLFDDDGQEVAGAFLDPLQELWDPTGMRLTLLFDPGRVKTGLAAHEQLGRALRAGRSYRLVIDGEWRDARGEPLLSSAEKSFHVAPEKLNTLDVSRWQLRAPPAGTTSPLCIRLPEPLDHALLSELVQVCGADGKVVRGTVHLSQTETVWEFLPQDPWAPGHYTVQIDRRLEDLAGNNLHESFEKPAAQRPEPASGAATLPFFVRDRPS